MSAYKKSVTGKIFDIFNVSFMVLLMIVSLYPMIHVASASLSDGTELLRHQGILIKPLGFNVEGYKAVFKYPSIMKGYLNTIFIVGVGLVDNLILTALGAYALSRKSLRFKKPIMLFIIFTMYFNGGLIPYYFTVRDLGLRNSLWALIVPASINTFNLIIMRTAFEAVPDSLEESAKLDGANDFTILLRIIIPLTKPVFAVMILYYGVGHWNSWFNAMLFLTDRKLYPLQLILREILLQNDTANMTGGANTADVAQMAENIKYATIMVATVPILCLYPFLQKYFVKGVMIGAIKG